MAVDTGLIGLVLYGYFLFRYSRWLTRQSFSTWVPGIAVLLALFPLGSSLSVYSMRLAGLGWALIALSLAVSVAGQEPSKEQKVSGLASYE